jgi:acyl-CoA thioester hydrolase
MYEHSFDVTADDIDALGHASNISYVRWIQDVAVAHSAAVGMDMAAFERLGAVFVVRRHEIDYLRPLLRGDAVVARTWIASAMAAKCHRLTELRRAVDGHVVARADTTWGFVDVTTGRPTRIPDALRVAFGIAPRTPTSPPRDGVGPSTGQAIGDDADVEVPQRSAARAD